MIYDKLRYRRPHGREPVPSADLHLRAKARTIGRPKPVGVSVRAVRPTPRARARMHCDRHVRAKPVWSQPLSQTGVCKDQKEIYQKNNNYPVSRRDVYLHVGASPLLKECTAMRPEA